MSVARGMGARGCMQLGQAVKDILPKVFVGLHVGSETNIPIHMLGTPISTNVGDTLLDRIVKRASLISVAIIIVVKRLLKSRDVTVLERREIWLVRSTGALLHEVEFVAPNLIRTTGAFALLSQLRFVDLLGIQEDLPGWGLILGHDFIAPAVSDRTAPA